MGKYDVVTLGELLIDFTGSGSSNQGNPLFEANPGGAPCNVLAMLNRMGVSTAFIGKVGDDMFGRQLAEAAASVGISLEGLKFDPEIPTTLAFVHTLPGGDREFSFYRKPGADVMIREDELIPEMFEGAKIFHYGTLSMTQEPARSASYKAIELAEKAGCILSFDPNLRESLWSSLDEAKEQVLLGMSHCNILKISDNEIVWLTGEEDYEAGVKWIRERYKIDLIMVSMGGDGSMAYSYREDGSYVKVFAPARRTPDTIETTGAGDTFCGSMLYHVLKFGWRPYTEEELKEALTFANTAASIVTTRKGALRVMPTEEEVRALL